MFANIALLMATALIVVFLLQSLARGEAGDFTVGIMRDIFGISQGRALLLYNQVIRSNLQYILLGAVAVFFLILSRFLLGQFSKYFMEISNNLDVLVGNKDSDIELPPEMAAMEHKLITIKRTLIKREEDARLAEQRKNDLVMYLAHDIKTPLASVIGYLNLLNEAPDMPPAQKAKYLNISLDKANRLEKLVDEFFEITQYSFKADMLAKEDIDLYYMLLQMTDEFYPLLNAQGKRAILDIPEDMTIYGDSDKLARVFINILKNAVAYSPANSVIQIKAASLGAMASIVFANAGGIPQDKLASIFDKFYRLDSARSSNTGGAGLGLAIAKEIVVSHGGRIYAESDGQQTAVTVEIPGKAVASG